MVIGGMDAPEFEECDGLRQVEDFVRFLIFTRRLIRIARHCKIKMFPETFCSLSEQCYIR